VIAATLLVTVLLIAVQVFMILVDQMDAIGQGHFTVWRGISYALKMTPYQVYLFFPVAAMLGCLMGLGNLASSSELMVMRASGMSLVRIVIAVIKGLGIMIIAVAILGETVVPNLVKSAERKKASLLSRGKTLSTETGLWVRSGDSFIRIGQVLPGPRLRDILEYRFDDKDQLQVAMTAKFATYQTSGWLLAEVRETVFAKDKLTQQTYPQLAWSVNLNPKLVAYNQISPQEMSLTQIYRFIRLNQESSLSAHHFELVFWQRVVQPFAAIVMIMLAIPFIFGPLRSVSMGVRLLAGISVGFGFHILNKFFGPLSLVYQLPPWFGALAPVVCFAVIAIWLIQRRT
jgi:lipopolysaccharide export system permease protein